MFLPFSTGISSKRTHSEVDFEITVKCSSLYNHPSNNMVRKNAAGPAADEPIMYEVDDASGNDPAPKKKKDKGKDLLSKFGGDDESTIKPRELTAKQRKALEKKVTSRALVLYGRGRGVRFLT